MGTTVACPCGQDLNVKPELVGRRIKCPTCGAVQSVPGPALDPTAVQAAPAAAPPAVSDPKPMDVPSPGLVPSRRDLAKPSMVKDAPARKKKKKKKEKFSRKEQI